MEALNYFFSSKGHNNLGAEGAQYLAEALKVKVSVTKL